MRLHNLSNDTALLAEIGYRISQRRIDLGITQAELAEEAGIGKRTLERLEAGESVQLANFLSVIRALRLLDGLESLLPEPGPSPMEILRQQGRQRRRASGRRRKPGQTDQAWKWGDEP